MIEKVERSMQWSAIEKKGREMPRAPLQIKLDRDAECAQTRIHVLRVVVGNQPVPGAVITKHRHAVLVDARQRRGFDIQLVRILHRLADEQALRALPTPLDQSGRAGENGSG